VELVNFMYGVLGISAALVYCFYKYSLTAEGFSIFPVLLYACFVFGILRILGMCSVCLYILFISSPKVS
jgi:hypothetical protein